MGLFLFAVGFIGFIVFLVLFIVWAIKKEKKKKYIGLSAMIVCFVLFIVGITIPSTPKTTLVNASDPGSSSSAPIAESVVVSSSTSESNTSSVSSVADSNPPAEPAVSYQMYPTNTSKIIVIATNDSGYTLGEVKVEATYYKDGKMLSVEDDTYYQVANGKKLAYDLNKPTDSAYKAVEYDDVKINITTEKKSSSFNDATDKLEFEHNQGADAVIIKCTNTGDKDITYTKLQVVYYAGDQAVGCELAISTDTIVSKGSITLDANLPKDSSYDDIAFDRYEVLPMEIFTNL